jgi:DNA-binding IclR family transcriptional regulator
VYVPTIRFSVLGTWIHEDMFAEDGDLICLMDTLRTQTGETILLGMQNDLQVQYLRILQSPEAIRFTIKPGTSRPICVAALGKALLSVQPEAHVSVLLRRHNAAQADSAVRLPARDFMEELREARRVGYANTEGNVVPGGAVVGMVLPTRPGQRALALGVGGPVERMRVHRSKIIGMMQAAIADFMHGASGLGHRLELATHGSIARPKRRG